MSFESALMLSAVLIGTAVGLGALFVYLMARMLLRPPRMTDGKALHCLDRLSPEDLGMSYQPLRFAVRDFATGKTIAIAGWWIPHETDPQTPADRCVVLIHGYSDAKVGAIAWAPAWRTLGFNILAIDLRAHGESDGTHCTGGFFERHDLDQVLNQLRASRPGQTRRLYLFGVSLGAAVAVNVAAMRDDLAGAVLESPFTDYRDAAICHAKLMNMPFSPLWRPALALAQRISGARFDQVAPQRVIPRARCPLLMILGENDPFVPPEQIERLRAAQRGRPLDRCWVVLQGEHCDAYCKEPEQFTRRLQDFVEATRDRTDREAMVES